MPFFKGNWDVWCAVNCYSILTQSDEYVLLGLNKADQPIRKLNYYFYQRGQHCISVSHEETCLKLIVCLSLASKCFTDEAIWVKYFMF